MTATDTFTPPVQDCGVGADFPGPAAGTYVTYHTHGLRQYPGTCKYHAKLDCPVLVRWSRTYHRSASNPRRYSDSDATVLREPVDGPAEIIGQMRCRVCWKTDGDLKPLLVSYAHHSIAERNVGDRSA